MALPTTNLHEIVGGALQDVERISSLRNGSRSRVFREMEKDLKEAQRILARRLRETSRPLGGPDARFTEAGMVSYQRQIQLSLEYVKARMNGLTEAQATAAIRQSYNRTIQVMEGLERRFTGITRPLQLREASRLNAAIGRSAGSLLARVPTSWDRYGLSMIGEFERYMRAGLTTGASMDEMIGALTGHGGPTGKVSLRARVTPQGILRLQEADIPEGLFVRYRSWAERIVRTETMAAYNGARYEGLEEIRRTDFPDMQKKIVAILDQRTAPDSIYVNGQVRNLNASFEDGAGRTYLYPPARPNDRETVIPWRPRWEGPAREIPSQRQRALVGELSERETETLVQRARRRAGDG